MKERQSHSSSYCAKAPSAVNSCDSLSELRCVRNSLNAVLRWFHKCVRCVAICSGCFVVFFVVAARDSIDLFCSKVWGLALSWLFLYSSKFFDAASGQRELHTWKVHFLWASAETAACNALRAAGNNREPFQKQISVGAKCHQLWAWLFSCGTCRELPESWSAALPPCGEMKKHLHILYISCIYPV